MPESNKAKTKRIQKANRAAGVGDETGRIVRVKDAAKMSLCTVCQAEMRITKTNTELNLHATNRHGKTLEECFPGAKEIADELVKAKSGKGGGGAASGETKAQKKKNQAADMDDLLSAGLSTGKKGKK